MDATVTAHPDAVLSARADDRLAHAYEQIARADEQLARVTAKLSRLEADTPRAPAFAGGPRGPRRSQGSAGSRGLTALVLAALIGFAAFALNSPQGLAARQAIAPRLPSYVSASWMFAPRSQSPAQPGAVPVRLAAAETNLLQPTSVAQDASTSPAAAPAPSPGDLMQAMQTMSHDLAAVEQGIEQLKANLAQIAADNAKAIEQLRANQEQLRLAVSPPDKPAVQPMRARPPLPPPGAPKPVASAARKPLPAPPSQARPRPLPPPAQ